MQAMPILASRRLGALQLALAGTLLLAPAVAEAYTTRSPQRAGAWHGHQVQPAKPARMAKRATAKVRSNAQPKAAQAAKPAEASGPVKPSDQTGTWTASDGGRACFRGRRKLWQADEGWVVKKVNVCP